MGEVREYTCSCGYQTELHVGGGLQAINKRMIARLFPKEWEALQEDLEKNKVQSYRMDNALTLCSSCRSLAAVARLSYTLADGQEISHVKPCPMCGGQVQILEDQDHVMCPKCGEEMTFHKTGLWD